MCTYTKNSEHHPKPQQHTTHNKEGARIAVIQGCNQQQSSGRLQGEQPFRDLSESMAEMLRTIIKAFLQAGRLLFPTQNNIPQQDKVIFSCTFHILNSFVYNLK
jgi:hypothetical protein